MSSDELCSHRDCTLCHKGSDSVVVRGVVLGYERYLVRFPMSYDFTVMLENSLYSIVNTE